jgi:hypothetical protein
MGHAEQAIELVSAILADPAGSQQMWAQPTAIHELAEETRAELEHQLDPDAYAASWTRGRSRSTDVAAEALLAVRRR